ncbi:MAG: hypothetical protein KDE19_10790 [Caldilineaceae bacterium]|nr:hypothetical protein [Caldilineaceae bacterium]
MPTSPPPSPCPTAGTYTSGVFRISLVEPDLTRSAALRQQDNVLTVFQLQGSLTTNEGSNEWKRRTKFALSQIRC